MRPKKTDDNGAAFFCAASMKCLLCSRFIQLVTIKLNNGFDEEHVVLVLSVLVPEASLASVQQQAAASHASFNGTWFPELVFS